MAGVASWRLRMSRPSRHVLFTAPNQVELAREDLDDAHLETDEVLIATEASLISAGTELARLRGEGEGAGAFPTRSGYACIGRILAVGPSTTGVKPGDRVFFAGKHQAIQRFKHNQDHQWGRCYPVPDGIAPEDAVFVCLAQIALVAPWVAKAGLGDTVAVFGLGVIGNLCAQLFRLGGARVIGLDPVAARCAMAKRCGVAETISATGAGQITALKEATAGAGAAVTVDAVGHSAVTLAAVDGTRLMGECVLLGTPRSPLTGDITALLNRVHMEGIALRGAHMWRFPAMSVRGTTRTVADAYAMIFGAIADGRLQIAPLRSHLVRPEDAPAAYRQLQEARDSTWGVVIDWRGATGA
jgi:threonine dehydrogenase-like Zn-dependent dehydrogenase